ncbi:hypothetical protein V8C42DRAFT_180189 [Trichoderma barbatum]
METRGQTPERDDFIVSVLSPMRVSPQICCSIAFLLYSCGLVGWYLEYASGVSVCKARSSGSEFLDVKGNRWYALLWSYFGASLYKGLSAAATMGSPFLLHKLLERPHDAPLAWGLVVVTLAAQCLVAQKTNCADFILHRQKRCSGRPFLRRTSSYALKLALNIPLNASLT